MFDHTTLIRLEVAGYTITKGTLILGSAHLAGGDPDVWDDPLRFHPDRFIDMTDDQRAAADAAWILFGGGRRNCIGFALAQMELTLLISRLAQRLDVTPPTTGKPGPIGIGGSHSRSRSPFLLVGTARPSLRPTGLPRQLRQERHALTSLPTVPRASGREPQSDPIDLFSDI